MKNPDSFCFTNAQLEFFPILCASGDGVWILVAGTKEEYDKLFKKPNWTAYLFFANNTGCAPGHLRLKGKR